MARSRIARTRLGPVVAAAALCLAPWTPPLGAEVALASPSASAGNQIRAAGTVNGTANTVTVTGSLLTRSGTGLANQLVSISVDATLAGGGRTTSGGRFTITVPMDATWSVGRHDLQVSYAPVDPAQGATAVVAVTRRNGAATTLTLTGPATITRGDAAEISGRLTTTSGTPVVGDFVTLPARQTGADDCTGVTGNDGRFLTTCDIGLAPGRRTLTASYAGGWSNAGTTATLTLQVLAAPTPTPNASAAASAASADAGSSDGGAGDQQPSSPASDLPERPTGSTRGVWAPLVSGRHLGLIGVGLLALLSSLAMLGRALRGADDSDDVRLIDD